MINKFQQGGSTLLASVLLQIQQLPEELQKQIMQAFAKWAQRKGVDIKQIQNNPQALEAALGLFIQEVQLESQKQNPKKQNPKKLAARHGIKLNYIKALKNQCPDGLEPYYYKKGGMVKCGCTGKKLMQDGGEVKKENAVTRFKKTITSKKSNLGEGIKKGMKTTTDSIVKTAKAKQWSDEYKRTTKASGKKDWVEGDKCGGKVKKHLKGGPLTAEEIAKLSVQDFNRYAPTTRWRYSNGTRINDYSDNVNYANNLSTRGVVGTGLNYFNYTYPSIVETVTAPGDTMYVETPELARFSLRGAPVRRIASTKNPKGNEYNVLKRRFNEAWNLAQ